MDFKELIEAANHRIVHKDQFTLSELVDIAELNSTIADKLVEQLRQMAEE